MPQPTGGRRPETPADSESAQLPRTVDAAAGMMVLEAVLLVALAVALIVETVIRDPKSLFGSLGGALLAIVAAAVLSALVPQLRKGRRFARTPVVVLQVLWLPVGFSLSFQSGLPEYGVPVLACALVTLGLFATPSAREALTEPVRRT